MLRYSVRELPAGHFSRSELRLRASGATVVLDITFEVALPKTSGASGVTENERMKALVECCCPNGRWWPTLVAASAAIETQGHLRARDSDAPPPPQTFAGSIYPTFLEEIERGRCTTPGLLAEATVCALRIVCARYATGDAAARPTVPADAVPVSVPRDAACAPPGAPGFTRAAAEAHCGAVSTLGDLERAPHTPASGVTPPTPHTARRKPRAPGPATGDAAPPARRACMSLVREVHRHVSARIDEGMPAPVFNSTRPGDVVRQRNFVRSVWGINRRLEDLEVDKVIELLRE